MSYVDAERIEVTHKEGKDDHKLNKFMRSNQGTLIHQRPIVKAGQGVKVGDVLADGSASGGGEIALGKKELYLSYAASSFDSPVNKVLTKLSGVASARNWNTVLKLRDLLSG